MYSCMKETDTLADTQKSLKKCVTFDASELELEVVEGQ